MIDIGNKYELEDYLKKELCNTSVDFLHSYFVDNQSAIRCFFELSTNLSLQDHFYICGVFRFYQQLSFPIKQDEVDFVLSVCKGIKGTYR